MSALTISDRNVCKLKPYGRNARMPSRAKIKQIAASIKEFGLTKAAALLGQVDANLGPALCRSLRHGRQSFEVARRFGRSKLHRPVVPLVGLSRVRSKA